MSDRLHRTKCTDGKLQMENFGKAKAEVEKLPIQGRAEEGKEWFMLWGWINFSVAEAWGGETDVSLACR